MNKKYFLPAKYSSGTYFSSLGNEILLPDGVYEALSDGVAKLNEFNCFTQEKPEGFSVSMQISFMVPVSYGLKESQKYKEGYTVDPEFEGYSRITLYAITQELFDYFISCGNSFIFQYSTLFREGNGGIFFKNETTGTESLVPLDEVIKYF